MNPSCLVSVVQELGICRLVSVPRHPVGPWQLNPRLEHDCGVACGEPHPYRGCRVPKQACLEMDPARRPPAAELMAMPYFAGIEATFTDDFCRIQVSRDRVHLQFLHPRAFWRTAPKVSSQNSMQAHIHVQQPDGRTV